mmetsp:Transcript_42043/g.98718  ORF Transcript_42043/g.98718 Transcript_42043/m.98718 type:complete len:217 (-) Transcript_42043:1072-1722(-)
MQSPPGEQRSARYLPATKGARRNRPHSRAPAPGVAARRRVSHQLRTAVARSWRHAPRVVHQHGCAPDVRGQHVGGQLQNQYTGALRRARAAVRRRELRRGAIRRQPHEGRAQGGAQRAVGRDARCATGALGRRVARCARGAAAPSAYGAHDEARRLPPQVQDGRVQPAPLCPRGHAHAAVRRQHAQPLAVRAPRAKLQHAQLRKSGYEDGGAAHPH